MSWIKRLFKKEERKIERILPLMVEDSYPIEEERIAMDKELNGMGPVHVPLINMQWMGDELQLFTDWHTAAALQEQFLAEGRESSRINADPYLGEFHIVYVKINDNVTVFIERGYIIYLSDCPYTIDSIHEQLIAEQQEYNNIINNMENKP